MAYSYDRQTEQEPERLDRANTGADWDPLGNMQRAAQAGLGGGDEPDYGLDGEFAGLILDGMTLADAVPAARAHRTNPAVRAWIGEQDPSRLLEGSAELSAELLDMVWPVGAGLEGDATLGLGMTAGLEFAGRVSAMRTDPGRLDFAGQWGVLVDLGVSAGEELGGAFDDDCVGAKVDAKGYAGGRLDGAAGEGFDVAGLLVDLGVAASGGVQDLLTGHEIAHGPMIGEVGRLLAEIAPTPDDWGLDFTFVAGAKVGLVVAVDDLVAMVPGLPMLSNIPGVDFVAGVMGDLAALGEVEISPVGTAGFDVLMRGDVGMLARVGAGFEALAGCLPEADVRILEASLGVGQTVELATHVSVPGPTGLTPLQASSFNLRIIDEVERNGRQTRDTLEFPSLADAVGFYANVAGALADQGGGAPGMVAGGGTTKAIPLVDIVGDVSGMMITREVREPVDPERLADAFPEWLVGLVGRVPDGFFFARDSTLELVGSVQVGALALQAAADAGLVIPPGMRLGLAVNDIAQGILAAACGQAPPAWLVPWSGALRAAAALVPELVGGRLSGRLTIGVGASQSVGAVLGAKVGADGHASVVVDQPVDGADLDAIKVALGSSRWSGPAVV